MTRLRLTLFLVTFLLSGAPVLYAAPSTPPLVTDPTTDDRSVTDDTEQPLSNPADEARAVALGKKLRCVVCQSESINDSQSDMARNMRELVREKVRFGWSDTDILGFMRQRYGDFILLQPRWQAKTIFLWLCPILFLGVAGAGVYAFMRRNDEKFLKMFGLLSDALQPQAQNLKPVTAKPAKTKKSAPKSSAVAVKANARSAAKPAAIRKKKSPGTTRARKPVAALNAPATPRLLASTPAPTDAAPETSAAIPEVATEIVGTNTMPNHPAIKPPPVETVIEADQIEQPAMATMPQPAAQEKMSYETVAQGASSADSTAKPLSGAKPAKSRKPRKTKETAIHVTENTNLTKTVDDPQN